MCAEPRAESLIWAAGALSSSYVGARDVTRCHLTTVEGAP